MNNTNHRHHHAIEYSSLSIGQEEDDDVNYTKELYIMDDESNIDDDDDDDDNQNRYRHDCNQRKKQEHPSSQSIIINDNNNDNNDDDDENYQPPRFFSSSPHLAVLPVILLEFLSLAITRAVLPSLLLQRYGSRTYIVMGLAECVRGVLAFATCPLFGKLSDLWGRRPCLLITVMGTLAPVSSLAFWKVSDYSSFLATTISSSSEILFNLDDFNTTTTTIASMLDERIVAVDTTTGETTMGREGYSSSYNNIASSTTSSSSIPFFSDPSMMMLRIDVFVILLALSGICSSTFTLTFAYISDVVPHRDERVAAYGLALATFGLSFTIGPLLGGYLANVDSHGHGRGGRTNNNSWWEEIVQFDDTTTTIGETNIELSSSSIIHPIGQQRVFVTSLCLAVLNLLYIHFVLPESLNCNTDAMENNNVSGFVNVSMDHHHHRGEDDIDLFDNTPSSSMTVASTSDVSTVVLSAGIGVSRRPSSAWWNPFDSVRYLATDPLLSTLGRITFFYYTALHAVVSTLILYATRQFDLGPQRLGELMAALGLSTMISEAVLVRIAIPLFGETRCMRFGLASFTLQCILLALADSPWQLFVCAFLAMGGNLVYPSVSSLVSSSVRPDMVGRALGAVNGVKSLTEGIGPLVFGILLTMSETDRFPGWPYFLAAVIIAIAFHIARDLPEQSYQSCSRVITKTNIPPSVGQEYISLIGAESEDKFKR